MPRPPVDSRALLEITDRPDIVFVSGQGSWLSDSQGNTYLDFVQGWAVNCLGHAPAVLAKAVCDQAGRLVSPSPACYNDKMLALGRDCASAEVRGH